MKGFAVISLCVIFAAIVCARPEEGKYTDQYDDMDIDEILNSERLLDNYFNCIKTGKKCTPQGQLLRETIPDALQSDCKKCTEVQKRNSKKIVYFLVKNKPERFKELEAQFDPDRKYRAKNADAFKVEGIVLPD